MPPRAEPRWTPFAAALLLLTAVGLAYHNSFSGPFIFDDVPTIVDNPSIRHLAAWRDILLPPRGTTTDGRPLLNLSLALNYAWSGVDPWSYHVVNAAIHALAGLTLFGLVRRTFLLPALRERYGPRATSLAFSIALLWLVHPLVTESVTYIVQRAESQMALFYLLTFYAFARAASSRDHSARWLGLSVAACFFGTATKEVTASAPLLVLLYDRTFVTGSFCSAWEKRRAYYLSLATSWLLLAALIASTGGNRSGTVGFGTGISCFAYWLTQPRAIATYLKLSFWPHPLVFEYGTEWVTRTVQVVPYALLLVPLLGATLFALVRRPGLGFLGAWFFLILAPTSLMPGINQMIVEHRMYLSLIPVVVLTVVFTFRLLRDSVFPLHFGVAVGLALLTAQRNEVYHDEIALWRDTLARRPNNGLAHLSLADYLRRDRQGMRLDRVPEAIEHYQAAIRLVPTSPIAHANYGATLLVVGRIQEAVEEVRYSLQLWPKNAKAHHTLGLAYARTGHLAEAITEFQIALHLDPNLVEAHDNLANALQQTGRPDEAVVHYQAALAAKPDDIDAHYNLANALAGLGRTDDAIRHYEAALALAPNDPDTHFMYGEVLAHAGRWRDAAAQYTRALQLRPSDNEAREKLARLPLP